MKSMLPLTLALFATCWVATPAYADVIPPDVESCRNKATGDSCTDRGASGTCQSQTCYRFDYASWDRDASTSPPSTPYGCVKCITGTNTSTTAATSTKTSSPDGGESPSKDDGACSIGKGSTARRVAPWLLAGAFSSLFLIRRRRRR